MKQILFTILILIQLCGTQANAYSTAKKKTSVSSKQASIIEVIQGEPTRAFVSLGFIIEESHNSKSAMKKLQKEAYKLGADAIIKFELKAIEGAGINILWGTKKTKFTAQGTAVKWK